MPVGELLRATAQAKRSASQDVEAAIDDETFAANGHASWQQLVEHSAAQHVRQCRDSKRVRANACTLPEDYVAALSLDQGDGETIYRSNEDKSHAVRTQYRLAQLLLQRGKPSNALQILDASIIASSADANVLCLRGRCFAAEGNHAGVRTAALLAITKHILVNNMIQSS